MKQSKTIAQIHRLSKFAQKYGTSKSLSHILRIDIGILTDPLHPHEKKLAVQNQTLTYRYKIPSTTKKAFPLSGFLAVIDEFTTWDLIRNDRNARFGVSTSLEADTGPAFHISDTKAGDIVELRARVEKIGNFLGFVSAEAVHIDTGEVICFARHAKFLSTGFPYDYICAEPLFSIVNFLLPFFVKKRRVIRDDSLLPTLDEIFREDDVHNFGKSKGKVIIGEWQTNMLGGLHGGSQAIIMENIGFEYVKSILQVDNPLLQSISISFMSIPLISSILFHINIMYQDSNSATMIIKFKNESGSTMISEGILRWKKPY